MDLRGGNQFDVETPSNLTQQVSNKVTPSSSSSSSSSSLSAAALNSVSHQHLPPPLSNIAMNEQEQSENTMEIIKNLQKRGSGLGILPEKNAKLLESAILLTSKFEKGSKEMEFLDREGAVLDDLRGIVPSANEGGKHIMKLTGVQMATYYHNIGEELIKSRDSFKNFNELPSCLKSILSAFQTAVNMTKNIAIKPLSRTKILEPKCVKYTKDKAFSDQCPGCAHKYLVVVGDKEEIDRINANRKTEYLLNVENFKKLRKKDKRDLPKPPIFEPYIIQCTCRWIGCLGQSTNPNCPECLVGVDRDLTGDGSCSCGICSCSCAIRCKSSDFEAVGIAILVKKEDEEARKAGQKRKVGNLFSILDEQISKGENLSDDTSSHYENAASTINKAEKNSCAQKELRETFGDPTTKIEVDGWNPFDFISGNANQWRDQNQLMTPRVPIAKPTRGNIQTTPVNNRVVDLTDFENYDMVNISNTFSLETPVANLNDSEDEFSSFAGKIRSLLLAKQMGTDDNDEINYYGFIDNVSEAENEGRNAYKFLKALLDQQLLDDDKIISQVVRYFTKSNK